MFTDMDILFFGRSEIIIIKHGLANWIKVPKLCMKNGRLKGYASVVFQQ